MSRTFVVAELGSVAEGDLPTMLRQIDAAADAGVSAVKAQWVSNPQRLVERRRAQDYAGAYANIAYPLDWLGVMRDHAKAKGLEFGCSCYLPEDAEQTAPFVDFLKIASFEAGAEDIIAQLSANAQRHRLICSLGMATDGEIREAVIWRDRRRSGWARRPRVHGSTDLLHCVSSYDGPVPAGEWQLGTISHYGLDGFSDHTRHIDAGRMAVLAGARIVEVHLRLADSPKDNPDFGCALSPGQLKDYTSRIRDAEVRVGEGPRSVQACERGMLQYRSFGHSCFRDPRVAV
jgi:sialic acid synthase SpsE